MQFVDLAAQQKRIRSKILANIERTLSHGRFVMGPEVEEFEARMAGMLGVAHAVSCSSGTDALLMALLAHGIGPGDAVFVPCFTFVATAEVVSLLGALPIFVDIEPVSFMIDPVELERAVDSLPLTRLKGRDVAAVHPKAVIAVDMFGLPADYERIARICAANGLVLIEDAAQSCGAQYRGRSACGLGDVGCTSFFPSKPLGAYGDGGMCFTDDSRLAETLRSIRVHGQGASRYENVRLGINGRLDSLQAAVLLAKLDIFHEELALRQAVAERYTTLLARIDGLRPPVVPDGMRSAWAQYSVLARDAGHRSALQERLTAAGIPSVVYYPTPLHLQKAFGALGHRRGDFPVCEEVCERIFSLPIHPYLTAEDQQAVAAALS
jgi:dTDP-4-amino-4,6-dideoxygalactose transaminase